MRGLAFAASAALILSAISGPHPVAADETWLFYPTTGHYYAQVNGLTWADTEAFAVTRGGHLVTINNQAEQDWLASNFPQQNLWIGFNDRATEGTWRWSSGESPGYTNWSAGEPNNYAGLDPGGEDGAAMNWQVYQPGNSGWNDLPENLGCALEPNYDCAAHGGMAGIIEVPRVPAWQADGRIRKGTGAFVGNNIYNGDGTTQTSQGAKQPGYKVKFGISIQNDGNVPDRFNVIATGTEAAMYTINYFRGRTDITAQIVAGTYQTPLLAPGQKHMIAAKVKVEPSATVGSSVTRLVTITSAAVPQNVDTLKFICMRR
jgi:hypothetical protein